VRAQLTPDHYVEQETFEREQSRIFQRLWLFAGLATFVQEHDDFFTCIIGDRRVVVQNFEGELCAFENVCAHRGKLIQVERHGTRPLVCGYHGWRYDCRGHVATIPFERECYRFDQSERRALRLPRFALRKVGKLIFVNLSETPLPFDEQFSPGLATDLTAVSEAFDDEVLCTSWRGHYNWKLAYENLRDGLHPRFVHTKSLNLEVRFGAEGESGPPTSAEDRDALLSELSFGGIDGELLHPVTHGFHAQVHRWGTSNAYFNWLLYPNTHMVSPDGGHLFSIEHHLPVAPSVTQLIVYYMTARKRRQYAGSASVLWEYAKGAKRILDEDTAVMEQVQAALPSTSIMGTQGHFERQSRMTDKWYLQQINGS